MKWQDVVIKKVFFCMFDTTLEVVPYSGYVPGDEDEMYRYLCQMVAKYYYHETSRKGFIHEESEHFLRVIINPYFWCHRMRTVQCTGR